MKRDTEPTAAFGLPDSLNYRDGYSILPERMPLGAGD